MTSINSVLEGARRITAAVNLPLLIDIHTSWGSAFNIARTIKEPFSTRKSHLAQEKEPLTKKPCSYSLQGFLN